MKPRSIAGLCLAALLLFAFFRPRHEDPTRANATPVAQVETPARLPPDPVVDKASLSSTARCGCRLHLWDSYSQPESCRLKGVPDLIGLEGYVRTSTAPVDLMAPPWSTSELRQSGPKNWDAIPSPRKARAKVRILEVIYRDDPEDDLLHAIAQVVDAGGPKPRTSYIDLADFDAVPWWLCTSDQAVAYSPIIAKPAPGSRPVDEKGRWVDRPMPARLWCWTFVNGVGVYCDPRPHGRGDMHDPTWRFKPSDLQVTY